MKKMKNQTHIEGYLYEHALEKKVTGPNTKSPGTEYINGTVSIATDEDMLNIVSVHYTYVTAITSTGKVNASFTTLENIINGAYKTVMGSDKEHAAKLRIDSAIGLNEFYSDRSGKEELVSVKRNEGGFIHLVTDSLLDEESRNTFDCDILITNVRHVDGDEENETPDKAIIKGAVFDFRNALLPVEFTVLKPEAMNYYEGLEATPKNPVFSEVKGNQISSTVVKKIVEESAFGTPKIKTVKTSRKEWVVDWGRPIPYEWDDESTITVAELNKAITDRELMLAALKARQDEYKASKANAITPIKASSLKDADFKF